MKIENEAKGLHLDQIVMVIMSVSAVFHVAKDAFVSGSMAYSEISGYMLMAVIAGMYNGFQHAGRQAFPPFSSFKGSISLIFSIVTAVLVGWFSSEVGGLQYVMVPLAIIITVSARQTGIELFSIEVQESENTSRKNRILTRG